MRTIHKYPLDITNSVILLRLPQHAELLTVVVQRGVPTLWALVETENAVVDRYIWCFGTGRHLPKPLGKYLGTVLLFVDTLVLHYFDGGEV